MGTAERVIHTNYPRELLGSREESLPIGFPRETVFDYKVSRVSVLKVRNGLN